MFDAIYWNVPGNGACKQSSSDSFYAFSTSFLLPNQNFCTFLSDKFAHGCCQMRFAQSSFQKQRHRIVLLRNCTAKILQYYRRPDTRHYSKQKTGTRKVVLTHYPAENARVSQNKPSFVELKWRFRFARQIYMKSTHVCCLKNCQTKWYAYEDNSKIIQRIFTFKNNLRNRAAN